jgi:type I restriction enzyme R subunit
LVKNGYPPQYSPEVFNKVMEQVENFEENSWDAMDSRDPTPAIRESIFRYNTNTALLGMVAEEPVKYGTRKQLKQTTERKDGLHW